MIFSAKYFTLLFASSSVMTVASRKDYLRQAKATKSAKLAKIAQNIDSVASNSVLVDFTFITASPSPRPTSSSTTIDATVGDVILDSASDDLLVGIVTLPTTPATKTTDEPIAIDASEEYVWTGGLCTADEDCYPKVRESVPIGSIETIGVEVCGCYANSKIDVFDECQGEDLCAIAGCYKNSCSGIPAFCSEAGLCMLHDRINNNHESVLVEVTPSDNADVKVDEIDVSGMSIPNIIVSVWCTTDSECPSFFACVDKSNGNCFFPPCGRCLDTSGDVGTDTTELV